MPITFAIIKERKNPPDRRVVFSPSKLKQAAAQYPDARFIVESSDVRIFPDQAYKDAGFEVTDKIILYLKDDVTLVKVFEKHQAYIQQETLTTKIVIEKELIKGDSIEFDQVKTIVKLEKVES